MATLGPWTLGKELYNRGNKKLFDVTSELYPEPGQWILKVSPNNRLTELSTILIFDDSGSNTTVKIPEDSYHKFGLTKDSVWFAMKKYEGHIGPKNMSSWKEVAKSCLKFLKMLHKNKGYVYMDFRMENILVDNDKSVYDDKRFVVADYELVDKVASLKIRETTRSSRWYYMARGAEPDEWVCSWKNDFMSLGYMLVMLTTDKEFDIIDEFLSRRNEEPTNHKSMRQLAKERNKVIYEAANDTLKAYFDKVRTIKHNLYMPPYYSFYDELIELFDGDDW
jgi:hypothetical protein